MSTFSAPRRAALRILALSISAALSLSAAALGWATAATAPSATFTSPAAHSTVITTNTTNTITWTENDGGAPPIIKRDLTEHYGKMVTPGSCAGGLKFVKGWSGSYTSPFTTSGFAPGYCYRWVITLTNGLGLKSTASSGNLMVQPPGTASVSFTSPAARTTVITTNTTNSITWTENGGGAPITGRTLTEQYGKMVTPGSCAGGLRFVTAWTGSYTSPFTTGGFAAGYCYRWTVTITNSGGSSASAKSGNLLVQAAGSPSASFTSPAAGTTLITTNTTNTISWTENAGGSPITGRTLTEQYGKMVTPGSCAGGLRFVTAWSGSYTSPFTTSGFAPGYCYRWTVTVTNSGGLTGGARSGNLMVK